MESVALSIPVDSITDWSTFHDVFQQVLGFPDFYGRNMDARVDCMTSLDAPDEQTTAVFAPLSGLLVLEINDAFSFKQRCPEQYNAFIECSAVANLRRTETGKRPVLALLLNGLPRT
jgi:hypothetical protein